MYNDNPFKDAKNKALQEDQTKDLNRHFHNHLRSKGIKNIRIKCIIMEKMERNR